VLLDRADLPGAAVALAGAGTCLVWRLLAIWRNWSAPSPVTAPGGPPSG
jgi:hypothetical protein